MRIANKQQVLFLHLIIISVVYALFGLEETEKG